MSASGQNLPQLPISIHGGFLPIPDARRGKPNILAAISAFEAIAAAVTRKADLSGKPG